MINVRLIRRLLWTYFWLLLLEGALRKWILPGLSNPLLLVRDPIALLAVLHGWPLLWQPLYRTWMITLYGITILAFLSAILVCHGDVYVAVYGARIFFLHFPLVFLFDEVFDRRDVLVFARILLLVAIPMTVLITVQGNLPADHFLNRGTGESETSVFSGALGRFRPSGVFSFISGLAQFYSLAAAAFFQSLYQGPQNIGDRILYAITGISLVVAVSVSISRTILFGYVVVLASVIAALVLSRTRLLPMITSLAAVLLIVSVATSLPAYQDSIEAFSARWDNASQLEAGVGGIQGGVGAIKTRQIGTAIKAFQDWEYYTLQGLGLGAGTNVGAVRLSGSKGFVAGEDMLVNHFNELGLVLGFCIIGWRTLLALKLLRQSVHASLLGNKLPLIMSVMAASLIFSGQISQPTGLGFTIVIGGLAFAACQEKPRYIMVRGSIFRASRNLPFPGIRAQVGPDEGMSLN